MSQEQFKYFAFISYNYRDVKWGKRLQKKLEHYRMPSTLCSEHGWKRTPLRPIFFAPTDIQPGGLTVELQERLKASRNLIVICSPNSAQSQWVGKEIEFFHSLGRTDNIHFFIVDGVPHSGNEDTECFNPIVETLGLPEILGANIHEKVSPWPWVNKERAYVQLITKLLGVEFDSIWQRHKRMMIQRLTSLVSAIFTLLFMAYWFMIPINLTVNLHDEYHHLPPIEEGTLIIAGSEYHFHSLDTTIYVKNLPGYMRNHDIDYVVTSPYRYCTLSKSVSLTVGVSQQLDIQLRRNKEFAIYSGIVIDEDSNPIEGVSIAIENKTATTDKQGRYRIEFPTGEQTEKKILTATHPEYKEKVIVSYPSPSRFILVK